MSTSPIMSNIYQEFGVRTIINARSYSTKLGGCSLPNSVLRAMTEAANSCVLIEDLQEAAGRVIAEVTGAETGIVTSGASAALTLAAAACLTGLDVSKMNNLPDTSRMNNEIICHRAHRNDYDHALRLAGAKFIEAGFGYYTFAHDVEMAINPQTVALFYLAGHQGSALPLEDFVDIAHRRGLPVIVDAAAALPPAENLKAFIAAGADLVAFSGGKHIRGPQATGILCGRRDLILAASLQHQDMDVFPETWPRRNLMGGGKLKGPPHHGIGRGFKVGKEEISGLMMALKLYPQRDFAAERAHWMHDMQTITSGLSAIRGISAQLIFPQDDGSTVPSAQIQIAPATVGLSAWDLINRLQEGDPAIAVFEKLAPERIVVLYPEGLRQGEATVVVRRLQEILHGNRMKAL